MDKYYKKILKGCVYTFCECFVAMIGTSVYLNDIDWLSIFSACSLAVLIKLCRAVMTYTHEE